MSFAALILFYVLVSAFGLYKLKAASSWFGWEFLVGFVMYGSGFIVWLYILRNFPLSVAFPVAAGSLIVSTQVLAIWLLKETPNYINLAGVCMIVVGIVLVGWGEPGNG